jgi:hypothetical protein
LKKFEIEALLSLLFSSGGESDLSAESAEVSVIVIAGSSEVEARGLLELARRLSNAPSIFRPAEGDSTGGGLLPSDIPLVLCMRVRSANSGPMGASSGFELRSVPRVRPIPALEDDMRRKSIGFASGGRWLELVGCVLFRLWRVE